MRLTRWLVSALLSVGLAGGVPAAASAASLPGQLQDFSCQRALDPLLRGMSVVTIMRPVTGTERLEVRVELLKSPRPHVGYHTVHGPNLGRWLVPTDAPTLGQQPGDVWQVTHPIVGLAAPAYYRLRVSFRWLGAGGHRLASMEVLSPVCHQLELRPDLLVRSISIVPIKGKPGGATYVAVIRNRGLTGAGPFTVALTPPGGVALTQTIAWLRPHTTRRVRFVGPVCSPGSTVTAIADSEGQVLYDYNRANNALTVRCPTASTAP